ncbi:hypothetical protein RTG_01030 [Rhodotorula toruloides ATCC 204091]|uniref:Uncharacterized protein n=1 Tax=Rhodotorula toruloides TaxID=5286 RepID=A0A0K3CIV0_RHOTO|nr:hypothetical protein RTG_01030 [Rhodotorula toruloides ATCC 204091]KAK4334554.1 hypothetical protein RTBOTA2_003299 [Rhodotorula toruloides]PRQ75370.1 hypothetical protein AAT19DRAFT_14392 [Rhodotorula toruloides]
MSISDATTGPASSFTPSPSSPIAHLLTTHLPNSPLVPRLKTLSFTLLAHKVDKETRRQVEQLRGEMRDRWRAEAWRVKASWMAGVVPSHEGETQQGNANERTAGKDAGDEAQNADDPLLQPTIMSDADGTAEMSRQVDDKVESSLEEQMKVAEEVVRGSVERSEGMEMELWLGQAILDGFSSGAGDEDQAARFVLDRLEDAFFEAGLSLEEVK